MSSTTPQPNPTTGTPWVNIVGSKQQRATSRSSDATSTELSAHDNSRTGAKQNKTTGTSTDSAGRNPAARAGSATKSTVSSNGSSGSSSNGGGTRSPLQEGRLNGGTETTKAAAAAPPPPSYSPVATPGSTTAPSKRSGSGSAAKHATVAAGPSLVTVFASVAAPSDLKSLTVPKTTTSSRTNTVERTKQEAPTLLFVDLADVVKPKRGNLSRCKKASEAATGGAAENSSSGATAAAPAINKGHQQAFEEIIEFLLHKDPRLERTLIVPTIRLAKEDEKKADRTGEKEAAKTGAPPTENGHAEGDAKKAKRKPKKKVECSTNSERLLWLEQAMDALSQGAASKFRVVAERAGGGGGATKQEAASPKQAVEEEAPKGPWTNAAATPALSYRDRLVAPKKVEPEAATQQHPVATPTPSVASSGASRFTVDWKQRGVGLRATGGLPFFAPKDGEPYPASHKDWFSAHKEHFNPSAISWMSVVSKQHIASADLVKEVSASSAAFAKKVRADLKAAGAAGLTSEQEAGHQREAIQHLQEVVYGPHCIVLLPSTAAATAADSLGNLGLLPKQHVALVKEAWSMPLCVETRKKVASNSPGEGSRGTSEVGGASGISSAKASSTRNSTGGAASSAASTKSVTSLLGTTLRGFVKRYNPTRGFGFIHCKQFGGGVDVFVHQSSIVVPPTVESVRKDDATGKEVVDMKPSFRALNVGAEVTFQIKTVSVKVPGGSSSSNTAAAGSGNTTEVLQAADPLEAIEVKQYKPPYVDTRFLAGLLLPAIRPSGLPNKRVASPPPARETSEQRNGNRRSRSTPATRSGSTGEGKSQKAPRKMVPGGGKLPNSRGNSPPAPPQGAAALVAQTVAAQGKRKPNPNHHQPQQEFPEPPLMTQARMRMLNIAFGEPMPDCNGWRMADGAVVYSTQAQQQQQGSNTLPAEERKSSPVPPSIPVEHNPDYYDPAVLVATTTRDPPSNQQQEQQQQFHFGGSGAQSQAQAYYQQQYQYQQYQQQVMMQGGGQHQQQLGSGDDGGGSGDYGTAYYSAGVVPQPMYHPSTYQANYQHELFQHGQYSHEAAEVAKDNSPERSGEQRQRQRGSGGRRQQHGGRGGARAGGRSGGSTPTPKSSPQKSPVTGSGNRR